MVNKQGIEKDTGGYTRDNLRWRKWGWKSQSGFTKRYQEIAVDRQEIETDAGAYTKDRLR